MRGRCRMEICGYIFVNFSYLIKFLPVAKRIIRCRKLLQCLLENKIFKKLKNLPFMNFSAVASKFCNSGKWSFDEAVTIFWKFESSFVCFIGILLIKFVVNLR